MGMGNTEFKTDKRFEGITAFEKRVLLASPTMHKTKDEHGKDSWVELEYIREAIKENWITCAGTNLTESERICREYLGAKHVVGLSCGTAAIHLAIKLAAEKLYGSSTGVTTPQGLGKGGSLYGKRVFCTSLTFSATVNPVLYEGGEPIFIDSEYETWNMDPKALRKAFETYPDVKIVIMVHLYGTPGKIDEIKAICDEHGAILIEDAAESLGAIYKNRQTDMWGTYGAISQNGNKIITGSAGGYLICNTEEEANKARKWSTQSREAAPWYDHEELGYNYRMSNIIAGIIRGQFEFIDDHIARKREIYERYRDGLKGLPVQMNPIGGDESKPNYRLSCMIIDKEAIAPCTRSERGYTYRSEKGKSSPQEILDVLNAFNAEGRPIWKPMHMQPIFRNNAYITAMGSGRGISNAYIEGESAKDVSADIFDRGLCLPSDIKMTEEEQDRVIEIIRRCFA